MQIIRHFTSVSHTFAWDAKLPYELKQTTSFNNTQFYFMTTSQHKLKQYICRSRFLWHAYLHVAVFWKIVAYLQSNKQTSDSITITEFSSVKLMEHYFCISIIVAMRKKTFFHFFFCRVLLFLPPVPVQQQAWTGRGWRVFWAEWINTPRPLGESGCPWCSCSACWCLWWQRRGFGVTRAKTLCATLGR